MDCGGEWGVTPLFAVNGPATGFFVTPYSYVANTSLAPRIILNPSSGYYDRYYPIKSYKTPASRKLFIHEGALTAADSQQMGYFGQYPFEIPEPNNHWRSIYQLRHTDLVSMNYSCLDGHVANLSFSTIYQMVRDWSRCPYDY